MSSKTKLHHDLLEIIEKQDEIIHKQKDVIVSITNENLEKENMIN